MTRFLARFLVPVIGVCVAAGVAFGSETPADTASPRTLDDYLRLARAANPGVKAVRAQAQAVRERSGVSGALSNPTLQYGYYVSPDMMQGRQELILQQEIPFPGKRGLRREVTTREAAMTSSMADAMALDVALEVKTAFYQLVGLTETARVLDSESDLLRRMHDVAQVRYSTGQSQQQEVLKIELALSRLEDESTVNRREIAATRARLNELVGREATAPLVDPTWVLPDTTLIASVHVDSALVRRPEMARAREQMAMADASRRLAGREYIPDFMLGVDYEFGKEQDGWWELMAGIDLPIWFGKNRAMVREADAMQQSAQYTLEAERLRTHSELEQAVDRARAARERLDRFSRTILPQAEATFASSEAGYRTGRVDFIDYLDSERMLLDLKKEYAMVIADVGIEFAALERAMGTDASAGERQ